MEITNKLIPGDLVIRHMYEEGPTIATYLCPRLFFYRWLSEGRVFEGGQRGFDNKALRWNTTIVRDGVKYQYNPRF